MLRSIINRFSLFAAAALVAYGMDVKPSAAVNFVNVVAAPTRTLNGACTSASSSRFRIRLRVSGETPADTGGSDRFVIYLIDGKGQILSSAIRNVGATATANRNANLRTNADPISGPFSFVIVDSTTAQAVGSTLSGSRVTTQTFDAQALDPDCPASVSTTVSTSAEDAESVVRAAVEAQTAEIGRAGVLQPAALTFGRLRALSTGGGAPVVSAGASAGLFGLSTGAAGQGAPSAYGIWADATWSQLQPEASGGGDVDAVTGAVGADMALTDSIIVGVALFGGAAAAESPTAKTTERSVGLSPYISFGLSETVTLQATAG